MAKRPNPQDDKRSRKDLELFILALVNDGVSTPYDLMTTANVSPGASIPALARLEAAGLVRKGAEGPRNRTEYATTSKGERFLNNSWRELFQSPPSANQELDAVLRIATLGLVMGETKSSVANYLRTAATLRASSPSQHKGVLGPDAKKLADTFLWMRSAAQAARTRQEAAVLRKLANSLRRMK
ncbi:MAG: PadR family transcriptional regulator [Candidatus Angelobacter sp.]